jgi:signal transduction histidine kinase
MTPKLIGRVFICASLAALTVLVVLAFLRDVQRATVAAPEIHEMSRVVSHRVDTGVFLDADALLESLATRPFEPPDGQRLSVGNRYFDDGRLWVSAAVPELGQGSEWTLWLDDGRVQHARLILVRGKQVQSVEWRKAESPDGGVSLAKPVFHLEREDIAGAQFYLGFWSFGALKGDVLIAPRGVYEAAELKEFIWFGLLTGAMASIAVFLLVMALRLKDKAAFIASILSVVLAIRISGDIGLQQVMALGAYPGLSDAILYGTQPLSISFWLLFLVHFMHFDRDRPRMAAGLRILAAILPLQGVLIVLKGGFIPDLPFNFSVASPTVIGILTGMGLLFWLAYCGDRRAQVFALCWLPLFAGSMLRLYNYFVFAPTLPLGPFKHAGLDLVMSMTALATLIAIDIQQRERRLKQEALTSEGRYRDYAEIGADGVLEVDAQDMILSSAGPLARALGLAPGVGLGSALAMMPNDLSKALKAGPVRNAEFSIGGAAEPKRWISISSLPLEAGNGFRAVVSDITDQVAERESLSRRNTLAALGQLAGGIAHEVNNLLHPMINLSRRVSGRLGADPDGRRLLDLVVTSGERAGDIVRQVLKAYSPERISGSIKPVGDAVREALEIIRATLPATITLESHVDDVPGVALSGGEMIQVLSNLVNNAVKAMRGKGRLTIRLTGTAEGAHLIVADDGPGMSEAMRKKAMEPFATESQGGIGLGLSIVQRLVSGWRGRIDIASEPGSGTRITIVVPGAA